MAAKTLADPIAAHELALYAINTGDFYRDTAKPIIRRLADRIEAGTLDAKAAQTASAWERAAATAATMYAKEFAEPIAAGDWSHSVFNAATRRAAAVEIAEHYAEQIADTVADLKTERMNRASWTLSDVRAANERAGRYFFSRDTMKFFGDTMASFALDFEGGEIFVVRVRAPRKAPTPATGRRMIGERRRFDPSTGDIGTVLNRA